MIFKGDVIHKKYFHVQQYARDIPRCEHLRMLLVFYKAKLKYSYHKDKSSLLLAKEVLFSSFNEVLRKYPHSALME